MGPRVFVLGHKGMLGHVAARYFQEQGLEVLTTDARYQGMPDDPLISAVRASNAEWVVNAIGRIKQKSASQSDLFLTNSQLPVHLKMFLHSGQRLIHASTDCVFSGRTGNYSANATRDADDLYGLSKILGEVVAEQGKCQILRTSIIGPELGSGSGLMGWFLRQKTPVKGFTNHLWNGISTLEWAKTALEIVRGKLTPVTPILQLGSSAAVTKHELLRLVASIWPHNIEIVPAEAPDRIDRTLKPQLTRGTLQIQLEELRAWYR